MQRVLILGSGGAGKSTLAMQLARITGIEAIHLDTLYWKPGWIEPDPGEWESKLAEVLGGDAWIMDGNYSRTLPMRLAACDTVVFLDLPRVTCLWRVVKRFLRHRGRTRPDMREGCPERLTLEFLAWVWNYRYRSRPKVLALLEAHRSSRTLVHLACERDVRRFLDVTAARGARNDR